MCKLSKTLKWLNFAALFLALAVSAYGQEPGCQTQPVKNTISCYPNPVPCAHCTGRWTDPVYGSVWTLYSNVNPPSPGSYQVSGSVVLTAPPGCPQVTRTVTGTIEQISGTGTTNLTLNAYAPEPANTCGGSTPDATLQFTGAILNDTCDDAGGTFTDPGGDDVYLTMQKPADIPADDVSFMLVGSIAMQQLCWLASGAVRGYHPILVCMAGRQAYEWQNYPDNVTDSCWLRVPSTRQGLAV